MKTNHTTAIWVFLALLAASIEPILVKFGYQGNLSLLDLLIYKHIFAAIVIVPLTRTWQRLSFNQLQKVGAVSLLLLATNALTLLSLKFLSAAVVVTLLKTTPAFVALANSWQGKDALTWRFWLGFGVCFVGIILSLDLGQFAELDYSLWGGLAVFGAVLSSTTYRTRMEDLTEQVAPKVISTYIFLLCGVVAVFLLPWSTRPVGVQLTMTAWMGVAAAVANIAFLAAIHLVGSTRMSVIDMLQRPIVILLAAVALQEPITISQLFGIACVFYGVHLAKVQRIKVKPVPSTLINIKPGHTAL